MGCICSKEIEAEETVVDLIQGARKSLKRLVTPSKKENAALSTEAEAAAAGSIGVSTRPAAKPQEKVPSLPRQSNGGENSSIVATSDRTGMSVVHQRSRTVDVRVDGENLQSNNLVAESSGRSNSGIFDVPIGFSGEHVAAGWPAWLTNVAPEAVNGWLPRRADSFEKLNKIGQGTYSSVYKARDLQTRKIVALKKVRFVNMDPESVRFMAREIHILRKLSHPNVVKLEGIITSKLSCNLYLVFEYMDHDLAGLAAMPGIKFTEPQIKCYMQQLFQGLQYCHSHGILHRDIKGSNLLIDNDGILKIADFGLATIFNPGQRQSFTSRVVTLWYRPPELLLGATEYGVAVDLWSSGCILAELLAGKPIMPGRTEVEQLHKIFKLCGSPPEEYWRKPKVPHATIFKPQQKYPRRIGETFRDCPPSTLALINTLLAIQPEDRGTASSALQSEFFTTKPFACHPSSLPTYPPSKEYDAKLRDEELRRRKAAARNIEASKSEKKGAADQKTIPGQRWQGQPNTKSASDKYNPPEEAGLGFPIDLPEAQNGLPNPNSSMYQSAFGSSWIKKDDVRMINRASSTVRVPIGAQLRSQKSCIPSSSGMEFANTSGSLKPNERRRELVRTSSTQKRDAMNGSLETTVGYGGKNKKIQYSGPLMPKGGNMEELLKEHERQIQQAVRKARLDKVKSKKHY
ncbi:probable serine/threonine-protein kinase At1g54610 [Phalaenopsis equestris]|uniref:probable serine/threonine-protein kinase At1g54610 n=1 Tax=Phalaenopsis equestris TaxID=78828 RepID=UPI0009E57F17|nr:probable serine/threonine-protein kinase At1g54610 [Phalaenopsis equestris]